MTTMDVRPYMGEADLRPIADLMNACEAVDKLDEVFTPERLRTEFGDPWLDTERNMRLWQDPDGQLIAFAQMYTPDPDEQVEGRVNFWVRPDQRGGTLEAEILRWAEDRLHELARERGLPAQLRSGARVDQPDQIALLERHGFERIRASLVMARSIHEPLPEPEFPEGFTLRQVAGEQHAPAWVEMFNQTWIDHWSAHLWTVERFTNWLNDPDERPDLNLVAVAPDGTFAAFCWCRICAAENELSGRNEGWVDLLGTRRGFRKIGLGRAMLLTGLRRLRAAGAEIAKLGVDASSPTGATRLYESVGFRTEHTWITFARDLE